MGSPGNSSHAKQAAAYKASPSASGIKPFVASATDFNVASIFFTPIHLLLIRPKNFYAKFVSSLSKNWRIV
jgi:hypothetical protein